MVAEVAGYELDVVGCQMWWLIYKNVVFSPLSIKLMLSIVAAGSNGPVRDQLLSFLQSESIDDLNAVSTRLFSSVLADCSSSGGPRLSFANGVWFDKPLSL
ncbi:hypothetical protein PIB30_008291 [Stylosanthes scabra]|uniref:Serpin domain-containing protein n=1 Tax=Stylosanthes scabra TaxID=79078 RepID=A0ABU6S550_9FABA|nr:hypothetical protein [Stylosanthes scabra]